MQYLLMIHSDEKAMQSAPKDAIASMSAAYGAYTEAMKKAGVHVGGERLRPSSTATVVRTSNGKTSVLNSSAAITSSRRPISTGRSNGRPAAPERNMAPWKCGRSGRWQSMPTDNRPWGQLPSGPPSPGWLRWFAGEPAGDAGSGARREANEPCPRDRRNRTWVAPDVAIRLE